MDTRLCACPLVGVRRSVAIPDRVNLCPANTIKLEAPKNAAPLLILLGANPGSCSAPRWSRGYRL